MKEKNYSPKDYEDRIYAAWESAGCFTADVTNPADTFTIVIPPPNITGQLHMGHAFDNTIQDILIRRKRMQGLNTLWIPGTDHASIATEAKIVAAMKEDGVTKDDIGRDGFLARAWEWKDKYGGRIIHQLKKLGSSCDWTRERFTLDSGCSAAVTKVFIDLYRQKKIYHGVRIINWCPVCKTSISDIECEYEEQDGFFWYINYPFADGSGCLEIATTRPETLLGDTAVAVNPADPRYAAAVGKTLTLPLVGREIPVVADDYVDAEFGTGAVKITPAHDPNDYEVGLRHKLPVIDVMDDSAVINENGGKYAGLSRYEARERIVADLRELGLLVKVVPHKHNVGCCQRCRTVTEPKASLQWFVAMKELAAPAIVAVSSGEVRFVPGKFANSYLSWMENIRDWCISRQLWWGHRIPAYYCLNVSCGETTVSAEEITVCPKCGGAVSPDEDTLDTWFSSALWPFSTLGWPDTDAADYKKYYPTNVLVTGYDIIPFWVARMLFSGLNYTGTAPFRDILIHGLIRDKDGRKMSKSLGNGIDPLDIIDKYGADALRLTIVTGIAPGGDTRFTEEKVILSRNFANKLWNAARYVMMNTGGVSAPTDITGITSLPLQLSDKWLLTGLSDLQKNADSLMDSYEIGIAAGNIADFIRNVYCDWYIELTKPRLSGDEKDETAAAVLVYVLRSLLKLLHPFMPFITEELWAGLDGNGFIMRSEWESYDARLDFRKEHDDFQKIISAVSAVRAFRHEKNIPMSRKLEAEIETSPAHAELFRENAVYLQRLAGISHVTVSEKANPENKIAVITDSARIFFLSAEVVTEDDKSAERERLQKEKAKAEADVAFCGKKLGNPGFMAKAPGTQIQSEKEKLAKAEEKLRKILDSLSAL
ncbi:valine--tRNA ligase [Clostridia bacterium]|nr:valine--tRNA ligase [Clostridia bacterium]